MFRLMAKLALLMMVVSLLSIALIRAQPYDDRDLRAFLTPPEGCPAPCFMGIRPRITSVMEAVGLLREHEWVESLDVDEIDLDATMSNPTHLMWEWSGNQPPMIDADGHRELWIFSRDVVSIDIDSHLAVGDLWLAFGKPDNERSDYYHHLGRCSFVYGAWYKQMELTIVAPGSCAFGVYRNKVTLQWMREG